MATKRQHLTPNYYFLIAKWRGYVRRFFVCLYVSRATYKLGTA